MLGKRVWLLVGLAVVVGGSALLVVREPQPADAVHPRCKLDGVWIVQFGDGIFYEQFVTDGLGFKGTFMIHPIINNLPDPGEDTPGPGAIGNIRRISHDTWEWEAISHDRSFTTEMELGVVNDITVFTGTAQLTDCDTQDIIANFELYSGDSDEDGDGFPDDGAEPIAVVEGIPASARRL